MLPTKVAPPSRGFTVTNLIGNSTTATTITTTPTAAALEAANLRGDASSRDSAGVLVGCSSRHDPVRVRWLSKVSYDGAMEGAQCEIETHVVCGGRKVAVVDCNGNALTLSVGMWHRLALLMLGPPIDKQVTLDPALGGLTHRMHPANGVWEAASLRSRPAIRSALVTSRPACRCALQMTSCSRSQPLET